MNSLCSLLVVLSLPLACAASNITYNVDFSAGPATVTGTITTDGTIGILDDPAFSNQVHIIGWNLTLSDPTTFSEGSFTTPCEGLPCEVNLHDGPLNAEVTASGSDLFATPTQLSFNFSASDGGLLIFETGADGAVCFANVNCLSFSYGPGTSLYINNASVEFSDCPDLSGSYDCRYAPLSGVQVIATASAEASSTPEPAPGLLTAIGFSVIVMRKRFWA